MRALAGIYRRRIGATGLLWLPLLCASPLCAQQAPAPVTAPAGQTITTFTINAFDIAGNTQLSQLEMEEAVYPFLGPDKTINDIDGARAALEAAYRKRGLQTVVVQFPVERDAQGNTRLRAPGGIVPLQVTEATVGRVRVVGTKYHSPSHSKTGLSAWHHRL
jgi:hemolysin activation/secretion protein